MELILILMGAGVSIGTLAAIIWSIIHPNNRLWPPRRYTRWTPFAVWTPTFILFAALLGLGILGWGTLEIPVTIRFGLGALLIIIGNLGVWSEVINFGVPQTGGAKGTLRTEGLYRFSRNPQYVSDILMILGWMLLSASSWACFVGIFSILVLLSAPFAEEPWLRKVYGDAYEKYFCRVRRFL